MRVKKWRGREAGGQAKVGSPVHRGPLLSLAIEKNVFYAEVIISSKWGSLRGLQGMGNDVSILAWGQKGRCESHYRRFPQVGGREALSPLQGEAQPWCHKGSVRLSQQP